MLKAYCCICKKEMDYHKGRYGREACCCSKECWQEFMWRDSLDLLNMEYYPKPKEEEKNVVS